MSPDDRVPSAAVHGPPSLVGVALGLVSAAVPYVVGDVPAPWVYYVVPPLVGLVLLAFSGTPRQLGIGLVASALALPILVTVVFGLVASLG